MMRQIILIALAALPATAYSGSAALGGTFNDVGMGTRPLGMGGAFASVADDANAVLENPAGMAYFDEAARFATFTHSNLFSLSWLTRDMLAYAQADTYGFGSFGLSWNRFSANFDPEQWNEDTFTYSGAKSLTSSEDYPRLALGWTAKYFRVDSGFADSLDGTTVGGGTASGYGFGASVLFKLRPSLSIAVVAQDLYSSLSWATGSLEILPMVGKAGLCYRLTESTLMAVEARGQQASGGFGVSSYHAGGEHWFFDGKTLLWNTVRNVGVRAGYFQHVANVDAGQLTAGGTAKADQWQIDYTYQFSLGGSTLGATHRFGLGVNF